LVIRGAAVTRNLEPILVVGGGLGGAAVALALARKGFRVRLIEQAPEFGVIGYGIQLGPNVFPMFDRLGVADSTLPLGVAFPAIVKGGRTLSAANVSDKWIGFAAEDFFEDGLGRDIHFANDADVAGIAEVRYGAAKGAAGLTILTTLGTGIGTALIYDDVLVPNSELGHLQRAKHGKDAEAYAAYSAMERDELSWAQWTERLQWYYSHLEFLFSPDLFVVGGGVSKHADEFLPLLDLKTRIVPAVHRNNAGIIGAASLAGG